MDVESDTTITGQFITFLFDNWLTIIVVITLIIYRKKLLWEPLSGGNGHIHMDEAAKAIILIMFMYFGYKEANRERVEPLFSDAVYAILLAGIFGIAAIKPVTEVFKVRRYDNHSGRKSSGESPYEADTM